jgi:hypothetical protein
LAKNEGYAHKKGIAAIQPLTNSIIDVSIIIKNEKNIIRVFSLITMTLSAQRKCRPTRMQSIYRWYCKRSITINIPRKGTGKKLGGFT